MDAYIERTCTVIGAKEGDEDHTLSRPLSEFGECGAYVLLAAPGAGKTAAFKHEAGEQGFCDARDFTTLRRKHWSNVSPLFIDGLDELRSGSPNERTPLDKIRRRLDRLGRPRFRLSCRETDWFGHVDRERLESVAPDGVVMLLRLDPLGEDDIRTILHACPRIPDGDEFMAKARENGLYGLLTNPQCLDMLVRAVTAQGDGTWPKTRTDAFELACRSLVCEHNDQHILGRKHQPEASVLLDAAGHLCAVQLLTGSAGHDLSGKPSKPDYIDLGELADTQGTLRITLGTKLFRSPHGMRVTPIHRHVAEFLAGRYLSGLVTSGLPPGRLLALLTGHDGRPVSALRGVTAWLSAHCKAVRVEMTEQDPLGTTLYGDIRNFSVAEKRQLLDGLEECAARDPRVFGALYELDSRWEDLATPDMAETLREILMVNETGPGKQTVALAVLQSLQRDTIIPRLTPVLLDVVKSDHSWSRVREAALEAYTHQSGDQSERDRELKTLLDDVYKKSVSDPIDNLLGLLLRELYPRVLRPAEAANYLKERTKPIYGGWYWHFWEERVSEHSTDDQFAEFLDALHATYRNRGWTREGDSAVSYWLRTLPARLLARYLERSPAIEDHQLFDWLGFVVGYAGYGAETKVRKWLSGHPDSFKSVVRLAADRYADPVRLQQEIHGRLANSVEPSGFGAWCLAQAAQTTNTEAATEFFLTRAIALQGAEAISDDFGEETLGPDRGLLARYKKLREDSERELAEFGSTTASLEQQRRREAEQRRDEWSALVKTHVSELRTNQTTPELLHRLACVYLGQFVDVEGDDGRSRLRCLLGGDGLVDAVVEAFRTATTREDLPDSDRIFVLADQRNSHPLMLPFLVGLEQYPALEVGEPPLDEHGMLRALAFRFNAPDFWRQEPQWFRAVLKARPDLVAQILIRSVRVNLRRGASSSFGLGELARDRDYRPVADLAMLPLLKSFPTRHRKEQLRVLRVLLHAALRCLSRDELLGIVEGKLALSSLDTSQQMYWICAGLLKEPRLFIARTRDKLVGRGHERRARRIAEFIYDCDPVSLEVLDVPALELLIESLGNSYRPIGWSEDGSGQVGKGGTKPEYTGLIVDSLINVLSSNPSNDASTTLDRLSRNHSLKPWRLRLQDAASRQLDVRRDADFQHPTVHQVLETFGNRRPANATDLAALTNQPEL